VQINLFCQFMYRSTCIVLISLSRLICLSPLCLCENVHVYCRLLAVVLLIIHVLALGKKNLFFFQFMTDGMMIKEIMQDPLLKKYR
jgi:hypothetical protein